MVLLFNFRPIITWIMSYFLRHKKCILALGVWSCLFRACLSAQELYFWVWFSNWDSWCWVRWIWCMAWTLLALWALLARSNPKQASQGSPRWIKMGCYGSRHLKKKTKIRTFPYFWFDTPPPRVEENCQKYMAEKYVTNKKFHSFQKSFLYS